MISNLALTSEHIEKAVEAVKKSKPVYADLLDFYGRIFDAQEDSKGRIQIEPLQISEAMLSVKAREQLPLIGIEEFVYDDIESGNLFITICNLAKEANPKLAASAKVILEAVDTAIKPDALFSGLIDGNEALFENITDEFEIEKQVLGFITYNSLKPSLTVSADQLSSYLNKDEPWLKGYCPICGSPPILSIFEDDGERSLICGFCWHTWPVKRVFCPFCENRDGKTLQYFYSEDEKEFRVDLCDSCKKYLKTLDARKTERLIYPPLEQVSSLHLDYKAKEMGYQSGIQLFMQV
jgi:FdhE protein